MKLGFFNQILGIAATLLGLALAGLWLFPLWWTPYGFAALLAVCGELGFMNSVLRAIHMYENVQTKHD